jgi:hypothetical protein
MPLEVRVDDRVVKLAMADGRGELTLPANAVYTIDPASRILRQQAHIDEWQRAEEARKKKAKK